MEQIPAELDLTVDKRPWWMWWLPHSVMGRVFALPLYGAVALLCFYLKARVEHAANASEATQPADGGASRPLVFAEPANPIVPVEPGKQAWPPEAPAARAAAIEGSYTWRSEPCSVELLGIDDAIAKIRLSFPKEFPGIGEQSIEAQYNTRSGQINATNHGEPLSASVFFRRQRGLVEIHFSQNDWWLNESPH